MLEKVRGEWIYAILIPRRIMSQRIFKNGRLMGICATLIELGERSRIPVIMSAIILAIDVGCRCELRDACRHKIFQGNVCERTGGKIA